MKANQLSSLAQRYGSYLLKAIGLFTVIYVVCAVTSARFETLREQSVGLPSGYISAAQRTRELDCLTRNIYWEAANEPFEGKVGVAQVTLNRVESGKFASSVCAVVYQKNVFCLRRRFYSKEQGRNELRDSLSFPELDRLVVTNYLIKTGWFVFWRLK